METVLRDLFFDAFSNAIKWGPGMILALVMLYGLYRVILKIFDKPTQALMNQASSMDRLSTSIQEYVKQDRSEHREIIILQKVILEKIERLKGGFDG
ncbi:MAG: hypothetical protein QME78_13220 [Thermodesulfobacteriota bacterium]|nr:hypothetical protein [Thermodesulfobacteriota bacterium]